MSRVEFVSYDGDYPNLCYGTLVLRIDGAEIALPPGALSPGGLITEDYTTELGPWSFNADKLPPGFPETEALDVVNANVPWGRCGGCI